MLIKITKGRDISFKEVTLEELKNILNEMDVYSISSSGLWENEDISVVIVIDDGGLNDGLIGYFLDNTTKHYLMEYYGLEIKEDICL